MALMNDGKTSLNNKTFRDISDKLKFESSEDNILEDFYIPALQRAIRYDRIAGFFNSSSLALAVDGFSDFFIKSGNMRLICCARLEEKDANSINNGASEAYEVIENLSLDEIKNEIIFNRMKILSWLVSSKRLQIRIALFKDNDEKILPYLKNALHHSKVGIMADNEGNKISFSGSVNESALGWGANIEEFKVFRNWMPAQREYLLLDEVKFENYWGGKNKRIKLIDIPEAINKKLIEFAPKNEDELNEVILKFKRDNADETSYSIKENTLPRLPQGLIWREHQKDAIKGWVKRNGRGIFKMATGAGKTKAALGALVELNNLLKDSGELPLVTVIVCPYQHLVRQWKQDCHLFNMNPILCFRSKSVWENELAREVNLINSGQRLFISVIVTNSTFISEAFQDIILRLNKKVLLICDEAHNLGSERAKDRLLENANFRLALSATFERHNDEEGTNLLNEYFGDICIDFSLKEAIVSGCLCKYDYFPIIIHLTDEENEEYENITKLIYQKIGKNKEPNINDERIKMLLLKRARIVASAKNKYVELKKIFSNNVNNYTEIKNTLIFCGDGQVECEIDGIVKRQVEQVTQLMGNEFRLRVSSYTAKNTPESRERIINSFKTAETQVIVAIRCLDEGVDIPVAECAYFLASTTNPRQFIQRRGRILRKDPQNPNKVAQVYDFLAMPRCAETETTFLMERGLVKKELRRAIDFAKYARNQYDSQNKFLDIQNKYNLLDL